MHWRVRELEHFCDRLPWLGRDRSAAAYSLVRQFDSRVHLGLNQSSVKQIERIEFDDDLLLVKAWLGSRIPEGETLVIVFGEKDGFECTSEFFLANWADIFVPSGDDAMVY